MCVLLKTMLLCKMNLRNENTLNKCKVLHTAIEFLATITFKREFKI